MTTPTRAAICACICAVAAATVADDACIRTINTGQRTWGFHLALSADGKVLATGGNEEVKLWDTSEWKVMTKIEDVGPLIALSPDGRLVVTAHQSRWHNSERLEVFDTTTVKKVMTVPGAGGGDHHPYGVSSLAAFSPNSRLLATVGCYARRPQIWDTGTWELRREFERLNYGRPTSIAFSPDSMVLAIGQEDQGKPDRSVRMLDVESGDERRLSWQPQAATSLTFSHDGKVIAAASNSLWLWDFETTKLLLTIDADQRHIFGIAFSPDDSLVATAGGDGTIKLWNVSSGQLFARLEATAKTANRVLDVTFMAANGILLSGDSDGRVKLWDIRRLNKSQTK